MTALSEILHEASSSDGEVHKLKELLDPSLLDGFDYGVSATEARDNPLHYAALHGNVEFTREILRLKPQLAEMFNGEGCLPLHLAAARGHLQIVKMLADRANQVLAQGGQNVLLCPESKYGYMPAHIAAINGKYDIVQILVERCNDVLDKTTHRHETLLHLAVLGNDLESVGYFINQGININEKDVDGNTCLHLTCKKKNRQVVTYLLDQKSIEMNSTNRWGLTPLDVLLVLCDSATDASLVNTLRKAGGKEGTEQGNLESNVTNSKQIMPTRKKHKAEKKSDAKTLLVVATLVATITFPAISNPPGGFIQLPFEKNDASNGTFYANWEGHRSFPAGRPVLLWELKAFFVLDSAALFSSISVILFLLCGIPRTRVLMKFLVAVLWLSAFCTALAFGSAFLVIYVPDFYDLNGYRESKARFQWLFCLLISWFVVFVLAALWSSYRVMSFLWRKGGFKRKLPNWFHKIGWPKNEWFRKTTSIIFMLFFLVILGFSTWGLWWLIFDAYV